jgi:phage-related protein
MTIKPVVWLGSSRGDVRTFPGDARLKVGHELFQVQQGLTPSDWKPMQSVGPGVVELRVYTGRAFRVVYVARFEDAIYVLHAFEKRTQRTRSVDLDLARKRLRDLMQSRGRR